MYSFLENYNCFDTVHCNCYTLSVRLQTDIREGNGNVALARESLRTPAPSYSHSQQHE